MPPYFKHSAVPKGVQKVQTHKPKPFFYGLKKATQSYLHSIVPQSWFPVAPAPISSVFETRDCIWYHGTIYVRESAAVEKIEEKQQQMHSQHVMELQHQTHEMHEIQELQQPHQDQPHMLDVGDYDDDTESTTSGNGSALKSSRNIGKINQLKYLKDGMHLRHVIMVIHVVNEWFATFDAETNRIVRTPDGVAFDTLRQFARVHSNEVVPDATFQCNVWSDAHFQYHDDVSGQWHPLSELKKH
jgi:hypothetical protein